MSTEWNCRAMRCVILACVKPYDGNSGPAEVMSTLLLLLTMGTGGAGVLCASPSDSRALSALASISIDIKRRFKGVRRRDERLGWAHSLGGNGALAKRAMGIWGGGTALYQHHSLLSPCHL